MKKVLAAIGVLLFTAGICWAHGYEVKGKAGSYTVMVTFDKSKPVKGKNRLEIVITDAASRPVTGVHVKVDYLMPSLPGKPPMMAYTTMVNPIDSKHEAIIDLTMKGEWQMIISITAVQRTEKAVFAFEVE